MKKKNSQKFCISWTLRYGNIKKHHSECETSFIFCSVVDNLKGFKQRRENEKDLKKIQSAILFQNQFFLRKRNRIAPAYPIQLNPFFTDTRDILGMPALFCLEKYCTIDFWQILQKVLVKKYTFLTMLSVFWLFSQGNEIKRNEKSKHQKVSQVSVKKQFQLYRT